MTDEKKGFFIGLKILSATRKDNVWQVLVALVDSANTIYEYIVLEEIATFRPDMIDIEDNDKTVLNTKTSVV